MHRQGRDHAERIAQSLTREIKQAGIALLAASAMLPEQGHVLRPDDRFERAITSLFVNNLFLYELSLVNQEGSIPFRIHNAERPLISTRDTMEPEMAARWQKVLNRGADRITLFGISDRHELSAVEFWKPVVDENNRRTGFVVLHCQLVALSNSLLHPEKGSLRRALILTDDGKWIWGPMDGVAPDTFQKMFDVDPEKLRDPMGVLLFDRQHLVWTPLRHDEKGRKLGGVTNFREFIGGDLSNRFELVLDNMDWRVYSWLDPGVMRGQIQERLRLRRISLLIYYLILVVLGAMIARLYATTIQSQRDQQEEEARERSEGHKRLLEEIEIARRMIRSLLPANEISMPGMKINARYQPAGRVGGDFYDYLSYHPQRTAFYLLDVMGHGIPAALNTTLARSVFRNCIQESCQSGQPIGPAAILSQANDRIAGNLGEDRFICALVGILDSSTAQLQMAFAGIPPVMILRTDGSLEKITLSGTPIGIFAGLNWEEISCPFGPGDRALLYTDGILDARNDREEMFGDERLEAILRRTSGLSLSQVKEDILHEVQRFCNGIDPADDLTFLLLEGE